MCYRRQHLGTASLPTWVDLHDGVLESIYVCTADVPPLFWTKKANFHWTKQKKRFLTLLTYTLSMAELSSRVDCDQPVPCSMGSKRMGRDENGCGTGLVVGNMCVCVCFFTLRIQ